ncbi:MAG: DNA methyltransferase [Candidatus Parvarchaeota archaeon]
MEDVQQTIYGDGTDIRAFYELLNHTFSVEDALDTIDKINWDFRNFNTQYLTHRFHSYPARFIPQIPYSFIKLFTNEGDTVLDPMCGSGTTIVEAFLNNRNAIGNDFNPLSTLITKVKTTMISNEDFIYLDRKLRTMKRYIDLDYKRMDERLQTLPNRKISKIFNKMVISKLETIRETIDEINIEGFKDLYDLCRVAFSHTIWSLVENGTENDVVEHFLNTIELYKRELIQTRNRLKSFPIITTLTGDARKLTIEDKAIDLIVTSPPYVNALDYYRAHMYNMLWLGMDFINLKRNEIGGHSHFITNRFRLLSEYLGDMLRSMIEMNRVLRVGKFCVIVVGNSSLEYELIESHKFFVDFAAKIGFVHRKTIFRNIDTTKKYTSSDIGQINEEYIVVLQKERDITVKSSDDEFIAKNVELEMVSFREQIIRTPGTSIRRRKPTEERLQQNIRKINEAISTIKDDIKMKV